MEAIEYISFKINSAKDSGRKRGTFVLGPKLGEIVANNPLAMCTAVTEKTGMVIGVSGEGGRHYLQFSK